MEQYTIEQRAQIVEIYFSNQRSIVLTQRAYRRQFNVRVAPSQSTINRLVANFREQGAVRNLPGPGRHRTVHTADNIQVVQESIREDPETSTRRRSSQLGLSRTSLQRILHTMAADNMAGERPKRPLSAYMLWLNEHREQLKKENPGSKVTEIAKRGGELWRAIKDKTEWEQKAIKMKEEYNKAVKEYEANGGTDTGAGKKRKSKGAKPVKKAKKKETSEEEEEEESD